MKSILKEIGIYAAIVALFIVLAYGFMPELLTGKVVNQHDITGWKGMAKESVDWNAAHPDDKTAWSGSMFSGMPNVTSVDAFEGDWTKPLYKILLWGKRPASYLFIALLGAFLMMLSIDINRYLAILGAIAVAFCSYNMQIIQVGHNTKMQAIALAPWAIAAFVMTYRAALGRIGRHQDVARGWRSWLPLTSLGSVLFALGISMQIKANHVQITWYLAVILFFIALAILAWTLRKDNRHLFGRFAAASALLLVMGIVGIGTNANKLIPTAKYAPYTMRGGSELRTEGANDSGLSLDYATAWSYAWEELPNMLIPNFNGGSSNGSLGENSATWELFRKAGQNPRGVCSALPLYWGPQPFTAGPMYMGAITVFLFILGLCLLGGREKWWLALCCLFAVLLALGNHFLWFTRLCFEYLPMYSKFRTVSMSLVILQFLMPLLAVYTLDRILKQDFSGREVVRKIWISVGVTGGFCLLFALIPSLAGDFVSSGDSQMQDVIADALQQDRRTLLRADAFRSFIFVMCAAFILIWGYFKNDAQVVSRRQRTGAILIAALMIVDLWSVDKRYLSSADFITPKRFNALLSERKVDKFILEDKDPSYRVLDLSENTFNSSLASYYHKSIGGYSPTKMQRYQDLIDWYLSKEISSIYASAGNAKTLGEMQDALPEMKVISMLNTRYIIVGPDYPPLVNEGAMGTAWFVNSLTCVGSADEEIAALGDIDPAVSAVVRSEDAKTLAVTQMYEGGPSGVIEMTSYAPNELHYSYSTPCDAVAVFSEIYHPSWKAVIKSDSCAEASELPLCRVDWVLRAACIPAGSGTVTMRFEPQDYVLGARLSRISCILLLLICMGSGAILFCGRPSGKKE